MGKAQSLVGSRIALAAAPQGAEEWAVEKVEPKTFSTKKANHESLREIREVSIWNATVS